MAIEIIFLALVLVFGGTAFTIGIVIWVVFSALRGSFRALTGCRPAPPRAIQSPAGRCPRDGCGVVNPRAARFCRRCGHPLFSLPKTYTHRAPAW